MEVILKKLSVCDKVIEWKFKSQRTEGNDTWEFINCGTHSDAEEVAKKVKEQGRYCEIDFSSRSGWFIRIKIED